MVMKDAGGEYDVKTTMTTVDDKTSFYIRIIIIIIIYWVERRMYASVLKGRTVKNYSTP